MSSRILVLALVASLATAGTAAAAPTDGGGPDGVVDCVKGGLRALLGAIQGHPQPHACDLGGASVASQAEPGIVDCVKGGLGVLVAWITGEPAMPYACEL